MKKNIKLIIINIVIFICISTTKVMAVSASGSNGSQIIDLNMTIANFISGYGSSNVIELGSTILGYARAFTVIITVIVLTCMGIKYMFESIDQKAVDKKRFVNIAIGVVFLALFINIILEIFKIVNRIEAMLY
jgi:hypothetical protein